MKKAEMCHFVPIQKQKTSENSIFLKNLEGVKIAKNSTFSLSLKSGIWKISFLWIVRPKLKRGVL